MATEAEFWGRPIENINADLAPQIVPVKLYPFGTYHRARIVREALRHMATDPECCATLPLDDRARAWDMASASDETLAKLAGLLK